MLRSAAALRNPPPYILRETHTGGEILSHNFSLYDEPERSVIYSIPLIKVTESEGEKDYGRKRI